MPVTGSDTPQHEGCDGEEIFPLAITLASVLLNTLNILLEKMIVNMCSMLTLICTVGWPSVWG